MAFENKKDIENPEDKEQQELEQKKVLQGVLDFKADSKESEEFLNKAKGSDIVDAMKSDINSRLANINDEESKKQIEETIKSFDKFAKKDKLEKADILALSEQFKIIDSELGQEGGESEKAGKDFQNKQKEERKDYTKLTKAVDDLKKIFEGWNKDKMAELEKNQDKAKLANNKGEEEQKKSGAEAEKTLANWPEAKA